MSAHNRCSIDGCERPHKGHGLCNMHLKRQRRFGDPGPAETQRPPRPPVCSVEGCDRKHEGRGWCELHRRRWETHDDPLWEPPGVEQRFWSKVDVRGPDECWEWTALRNKAGYGRTRGMFAHCFAYELAHGAIPADKELHHRCENKACVNPAHLESLTRREHAAYGVNATKTHCLRGHPLSGENVILVQGGRRCRTCTNERKRRYYADRKGA